MTDHPITPPPELVQQWYQEADNQLGPYYDYIATQAARWGSDQELEACCEWLKAKEWIHPEFSDELRAARRPKPPSLKEQALDSWERLTNEAWCREIDLDLDVIRRALEALDD